MRRAARPATSSASSTTPLHRQRDYGRARDRIRSAAGGGAEKLRDRQPRRAQHRRDRPLGLAPGRLLPEEPARRMAGRAARQSLGRLAACENSLGARGGVAATLETHSFQARPFYEKYGYQVFATLDDWPPGHSKFFLRKQLAETPDN